MPSLPDGPTRMPDVSASRRAPRILIVENCRDTATSLKMLLNLWGLEDIVMAFDGPSALAAAAVHDPAVVLLDVGLPGMDGFEVARRLREMMKQRPTIIGYSG